MPIFGTGKTVLHQGNKNTVTTHDVNQVQDSEKTFDIFSIFARHLHSLTQLERTEILQTLTNISIYNAYCTHANFLWQFLYKLSEKPKWQKRGYRFVCHIIESSPRCTHDIPQVLMVSLRCTEHPPVYS